MFLHILKAIFFRQTPFCVNNLWVIAFFKLRFLYYPFSLTNGFQRPNYPVCFFTIRVMMLAIRIVMQALRIVLQSPGVVVKSLEVVVQSPRVVVLI